jgi:peptidoglycan/LPS O-acetylase OafA/YrhL
MSILRQPALYLSSLSFTLYLVHYPLNNALERVFPKASDLSWNAIGIFFAKIALLLLAVHIFYLAFEANTATVRNHLKRRWAANDGRRVA